MIDITTVHEDDTFDSADIGAVKVIGIDTDIGVAFVFHDDMERLNDLVRKGWEVQYNVRCVGFFVCFLIMKVSHEALPFKYDMVFFNTTKEGLYSDEGLLGPHSDDLNHIDCFVRNFRTDYSLFLVKVPLKEDVVHVPSCFRFRCPYCGGTQLNKIGNIDVSYKNVPVTYSYNRMEFDHKDSPYDLIPDSYDHFWYACDKCEASWNTEDCLLEAGGVVNAKGNPVDDWGDVIPMDKEEG